MTECTSCQSLPWLLVLLIWLPHNWRSSPLCHLTFWQVFQKITLSFHGLDNADDELFFQIDCLEDTKKLVRDAITTGIFNDLGSGSNVDPCVIIKEGTQYLRPYDVANEKGARQGKYSYKRGATAVLTKDVKPIVMEVTETRVTGEAMDM
ncbi:proteasome subunit beta type-7-like [Oculina patagonica]